MAMRSRVGSRLIMGGLSSAWGVGDCRSGASNRAAVLQAQGRLVPWYSCLAMLVSDEVARRENKKFSMWLRRAQFRTPFATSPAHHHPHRKEASHNPSNTTLIHSLIHGQPPTRRPSIPGQSSIGTGGQDSAGAHSIGPMGDEMWL
jgi:hypothetical protein